MIFVTAGLAIVGMLVIGLGFIWAYQSFRTQRGLKPHFGDRPVTPLAQARPGDVVHVLGTVESLDTHASPTGGPPSAYLAVDLESLAMGGMRYLKLRHGDVLQMRDATASASVQMQLANPLDRQPYQQIWFTDSAPPTRVAPVLQQHGIRIVRPRGNKGPMELRYRETAIRRGDPLRVHGLVLNVEPGPQGVVHVTLGTDQRVPLHVSNATEADLKRLNAKASKWLKIGVAVLLVGFGMMATGIAIGVLLPPR